MGFPRQEYWSGFPFPPPGDLFDPGIKSMSPALAGRFFTTEHQGSPGASRAKIDKNRFYFKKQQASLFLFDCRLRAVRGDAVYAQSSSALREGNMCVLDGTDQLLSQY